jgi:spermidine synthase
MPRPFALIESVNTPEGPLELRQRGERDFMIMVGKRVLMSSAIHRSELAVAELGCAPIRDRKAPRVLIGGLGLGYTLRAALDTLPRNAQVIVAELNDVVVRWCSGPCAVLTNDALNDPRVSVVVGDVTDSIRRVASEPARPRFDAIVLDLYVGPGDSAHETRSLYGREILKRTSEALSPGGVYAVWGEDPNPPFEQRLREAGFDAELLRVKGGGPRHAVYLAQKKRARK